MLGLLGLVLAAPDGAGAATTTVSFGGGGYTVRVTGETNSTLPQNNVNSILVEEDASNNVLVTDTGLEADVVAGTNCFLQTVDRVSCPPDPSATAILTVTPGFGHDVVAVTIIGKGKSGIGRVDVFGGPGNDFISDGPAPGMLDGDGQLGNGTPFVTNQMTGVQEGNDQIYGGGGPDTLIGHAGRDYLNGGTPGTTDDSANTLDGGLGADFFDAGSTLGADRFTGGSGDDAPVSEGTASARLLSGTALVNGEQAQVFGGDTVSYGPRTYSTAGTAGVVADLDGVRDDGATGEMDQIDSDVEALVGTIRDDRLTGSAVVNRIEGRLGVDTLVGGDSGDRMRFREGVADRCFVPGAGDSVDLDLVDPPATLCTPKTFPVPFTATIDASPADETMPYVRIGKRVRRRGARRVVATVACQRSAQRACTGRLSLARRFGSKAFAGRRYRARPGRTTRVAFRLPAGRVRALRRAGRVYVSSRSQGFSTIGPTTTTVARRF